MPRINVRAKGQTAERLVAAMLNASIEKVCGELGKEVFTVRRNLEQTQSGGYDLVGIGWLAIEVKHQKVVCLPAWWAQCCRQAREGQEPILVWKQDRLSWRVRMWARLRINPNILPGEKERWLKIVVDISWLDFIVWFEKRLAVELSC